MREGPGHHWCTEPPGQRCSPARWLLLGLALLGCSSEPTAPMALPPGEKLAPRYRFVDDALRPAPLKEMAEATIRSDTRSVLWGPRTATLLLAKDRRFPNDGRLHLELSVPRGMRDRERLFVRTHVWIEKRWFELPPLFAPVVRSGSGTAELVLELPLPQEVVGRGGVWVRAYAPPRPEEKLYRTPEVEIPERASLQFSLGILEAGWDQGPVEFSFSACREEDCRSLFRETLDPGVERDRGWQHRGVDLTQLGGQRVYFRFEATPVGSGEGSNGTSLPVWANPTLYTVVPRAEDEFNLILLSLDTLRADHLSAYGHPRATSPFIDEVFAAGGTLFETNISACGSTAPSHMTMFTSLQPSVHRRKSNVRPGSRPPRHTTLAEHLRGAGFATGAVTENGAIKRKAGFGRGFDAYVENRGAESDASNRHIEETFRRGVQWLERHGDERFFLFLHTYQVHNPFAPPSGYESFFTEVIPELEPPPELREDWNPLLYDREIRYTDDQLRLLYETLEERGLLDRTLFVLTSDHGEEFLEHGFIAHGADLHEEILHVPLLFRGPGVPAGRRVRAPIGLVDLMPTLLELLSLPADPRAMGRSYAALVRGATGDGSWERRPIYSEAWEVRGYRAHGLEQILQPTFSVRVGKRKMIRAREGEGHRYEYYDLERDPGERVNLYSQHQEQARDLRELLDDYAERAAALRVGPGERDEEIELDPDLEVKLRALGYLD